MIIDKNFSPIMERVFAGSRLTRDDSEALVDAMIDGTMSDVRISAVLTALRFLPITQDVVMGAVKSVLKHAPSADLERMKHLVDCGGTGGDRSGTVNISTMAAIVAAASGAQVAKFGSRNAITRCGSADVLEAVGIRLALNFGEVTKDLETNSITFLYAPSFYPGLRLVSAVRRSLNFHTIFDVIFPLANPVKLKGQLLGVYSSDLQILVGKCLAEMGRTRALVVHSDEGLDEISVCSPTRVIKIENGVQSAEIWSPGDFGMVHYPLSALKGGGSEENARVFTESLKPGESGPVVDAVSINAAAALWCSGVSSSVSEGLHLAKATMASGAAFEKLLKWQSK